MTISYKIGTKQYTYNVKNISKTLDQLIHILLLKLYDWLVRTFLCYNAVLSEMMGNVYHISLIWGSIHIKIFNNA